MYTVEELAKEIKIPEHTIRRWLASGALDGIKFGRQWRIKRTVVEELMSGGLNV